MIKFRESSLYDSLESFTLLFNIVEDSENLMMRIY